MGVGWCDIYPRVGWQEGKGTNGQGTENLSERGAVEFSNFFFFFLSLSLSRARSHTHSLPRPLGPRSRRGNAGAQDQLVLYIFFFNRRTTHKREREKKANSSSDCSQMSGRGKVSRRHASATVLKWFWRRRLTRLGWRREQRPSSSGYLMFYNLNGAQRVNRNHYAARIDLWGNKGCACVSSCRKSARVSAIIPSAASPVFGRSLSIVADGVQLEQASRAPKFPKQLIENKGRRETRRTRLGPS